MSIGTGSMRPAHGQGNTNNEARIFALIARIAKEEAGLELPASKAPMVFSRLAKRIRKLQLAGPEEYCELLAGNGGSAEISELITVLTTNVTSFFRERHHFDYLRAHILPDLCQRAQRGERIRFWSAGCSTGQEPYTLALEILERLPEAAQTDLKILATDIDRSVLEQACAGVYSDSLVAGIPAAHLGRYFEALDGGNGGQKSWSAGNGLRSLVSFRPLNLVKPWPMKGQFQVIFCRNVIIYFSPETQRTLAKGFAAHCATNGHLFLGHSERLENPGDLGFDPVGTTTYRKSAKSAH